ALRGQDLTVAKSLDKWHDKCTTARLRTLPKNPTSARQMHHGTTSIAAEKPDIDTTNVKGHDFSRAARR
ncbi:MAG: hypothetical protein WCE75_11275, partial [Terracidiphilus sp.]